MVPLLAMSLGVREPREVFIGNTNPASTEAIIMEVIKECAKTMPEDMKLTEELQILEVACLTKNRDGTPIRTKSWRIKVPHKFRDHMMRPQSIPMGWSSRRYFPPRAPRAGVPPLNPLDKRINLGHGHQHAGPGGAPHAQ